MSVSLRAFNNSDVAAFFAEASGGGDKLDIDALRNRPAKDPTNWLANIKAHSELSFLEVAAEGSVTRSQGLAGAASWPGSGGTADAAVSAAYGYGVTYEDFALVTHGLGYPAYAAVIVGGKVLHPGMPVQVGTGGAVRYATAYSTNTEIRVQTWCSVGTTALPSADITYQAIAFRAPRSKSGASKLKGNASTGIVSMMYEKFSADRKYLQAVDGGSPFSVLNGRGGDTNNGAARLADGAGGVTDTVPSSTAQAIVGTYSSVIYGSPMVYGGSYSSPASFQVQVPPDPPGGASGMEFDPATGILKFTYEGRDTLTNAGKLVLALSEFTLSQAANFPTFSTATNYMWGYYTYQAGVIPPFTYAYDRWGSAWLAAVPQEWSNTITLATVPTDIDGVIGLLKLTRTVAPADWYGGDPLEVLPKESVWIPFMGSFTAIVEAAFGMVRMISVYIEDGLLKLRLSQSVANAPGGFTSWEASGSIGGYPWGRHIEHYGNGNPGIPVRMIWNSSTQKHTYGSGSSFPANNLHKWDGPDPPTPPATPDFAANYTLDLKASFIRRS